MLSGQAHCAVAASVLTCAAVNFGIVNPNCDPISSPTGKMTLRVVGDVLKNML